MPRFRALIFFLFLALLGGVFFFFLYANRNYQRPPPASAVWSLPEKLIKIVSFDIQHSRQGNRAVLAEISRLNADFVLLQNVNKSDLTVLSEAFSSVPAIYHGSENLVGKSANWGNAIFSRYPVYEAGTVTAGKEPSFGVWATAVIGNCKFKIASIHLADSEVELAELLQAWRAIGAAPIIVGGDVAKQPAGSAEFPWRISSKSAGNNAELSHQAIFTSDQWKVIDAGASDRLVWVTIGR
jgi:hypothetical protein